MVDVAERAGVALGALYRCPCIPTLRKPTLFDAPSLQRVQLFVRGNLWEPLAVAVLDAPAFLVLGSLGAISILLGTKKNRPTNIHPTDR